MDNKTELFDKQGNALSIKNIIDLLPLEIILEDVNRLEVIDQKGRSYVNWNDNKKIEISFQDNGKALKVFISDLYKNFF